MGLRRGDPKGRPCVDFRFRGAKYMEVFGRYFLDTKKLEVSFFPTGNTWRAGLQFDVEKSARTRYEHFVGETTYKIKRMEQRLPLLPGEPRDIADAIDSWIFACEFISDRRAQDAERIKVLEMRVQEQREQMQRAGSRL